MTYKELLTNLVTTGRMWSWPYLRDEVASNTEEQCRQWREVVLERWMVYHYREWQVLLELPDVSMDDIEATWR